MSFFKKLFSSKGADKKYNLTIKPTTDVKATYEISFKNSKSNEGYFLVIDTETTGLPVNSYDKPENLKNWPYIVSIGWLLFDKDGLLISENYHILKQKNKIPENSILIHRITDEIASEIGEDPKGVFEKLSTDEKNSKIIIAHNIDFDLPIIQSEFFRNDLQKPFLAHEKICTMKSSMSFVGIIGESNKDYFTYKYPKLKETFGKCFQETYHFYFDDSLHNSLIDAKTAALCFFKLFELKVINLSKV